MDGNYPASVDIYCNPVARSEDIGVLKNNLCGGSYSKGAAYVAVGKVISYDIKAPQ